LNRFMELWEQFKFMNSKGFTLIELIVVIAIIAVLSGIVLLSVTQYINIGKDSNVKGNLSVLITDGEAFYNGNGNSYNNGVVNGVDTSFCASGAVQNAWTQIPTGSTHYCNASSTAWIACAQEFSNTKYYCVDNTGIEKEITTSCAGLTSCQ